MASEFKNTEAFVRRYGDQVEQEILNRIVSNGKVASGKLFNSLRKEVKFNKESFLLRFYFVKPGKDYADFVDKGVSGAGVPQGFKGKMKQVVKSSPFKFRNEMPPDNREFRQWMKINGIPKKASFPIRRSIWIFGITPTNFFTIPTTRRQKQFDAGVEKNMAKDIEEIIQKETKKK